MPSFDYVTDELARVGARFVAHVNEELQRALFTEKKERKLTQQSIADALGVNRSVVNRRFMGLDNLTARTIAETLWAIGWEPHFEVRKVNNGDRQNEYVASPIIEPSSREVTLAEAGSGTPKVSFSATVSGT